MRVEFWFEFASTYSALSALRLPDLAQARGIEVIWRPFLLGPIFAAQGLKDSPFNLFPTKGAYMLRDMARRAKAQGWQFVPPDPFPQNGLLAARVATAALPGAAGVAFCQSVYRAQFQHGRDISDAAVIVDCAEQARLPNDILDRARTDKVKAELRATTEAASAAGIFGAPSFTVAGELYWGDDRLEDAMDRAARHG